ncbi:MAG: hypothetical protein GY768_07000 [Planctomycetaceae bacterium]|nr:hypothetical protein [Planctomycetaceae bacterium]
MIDMNRSKFPARYRVSLGHASVTVDGFSPAEALHAARIRLSLDLPRLYDVIHSLEDGRFEVTKLISNHTR